MVLGSMFPWMRVPPLLFLIVNSVKIINELTDHFKYGTDPKDLYDVYDFIVGTYRRYAEIPVIMQSFGASGRKGRKKIKKSIWMCPW